LSEGLGLTVVCDLDEVVVRVSEVDGSDGADGSRAFYRTFQDAYATLPKVAYDLDEWCGSNQTDVCRTGSRRVSLRLKLPALLVKVNLLLPEAQCLPPSGESDDLNAKHSRVEAAGRINVGNCQDNVVKAENVH
jgi:hypothetical protein